MSPIETSELERRLAAGLDQCSRQASVPEPGVGRAGIAHRVAQRRRRRRTVQALTAVVVAAALVVAGIGLSRHHQQADQVVTGVHQQVPPLPQLGMPASLGQTQVTSLYPGNGVIERLSHLPQFSDELSVVLSDQSLDQLRRARSGPGLSVASARVGGRSAFTVTPTRPPADLVPDPSGVYWKPDAHHVAALAPEGQTIDQAVALAGRLVTLSDSAWWTLTGGAPSGYDSTRSPSGTTVPANHGHRLDDPAARLGLPGGRTTVMELDAFRQQVKSVLDVDGFPAGSFVLTTNFDAPITQPLAKAGDQDAAQVRGTVGSVQEVDPGVSGPDHTFWLSWLEGGQVYQLQFGLPVRWDGQPPSRGGRVPNLADAQRVARQLRVLSLDSWKAMLSPPSLRLDLTTPGALPCLVMGACAATPSGPTSTSSSTTSTPGGN